MADNTSMSSYQASGFGSASGVADMQSQLAKIPTSDAALREQAVNQYADTYKALDESFSRQLSAIITSQANDEKLLNEQYNNSMTAMMAKLQKRGLQTTAALPDAQTAALNKHRNETMAFRQSVYNLQKALPERRQKQLKTGYEQAIAQRIAANRETFVPMATDLLTSLSDLQFSSYEEYINYLLAKKAKAAASRRSSSRRSSSSSSKSSGTNSYVNTGDLSGDTYIAVDIYAGGAARRKTNGTVVGGTKKTSTTQDGSKYSF